MKPSEAIELHRERIREIVRANKASNPRVFGSTARGEDSETSDLDILIDPDANMSMFDLVRIRRAVHELTDVAVDVKTPEDLPVKFRQVVLAEARPI
ncbi:MAG TPA: nucleotidyltransferase domain-containing protein [Methylocella sp.]|nr:nucleotidyltransferase domain-containing protein [Methylocella sp.]